MTLTQFDLEDQPYTSQAFYSSGYNSLAHGGPTRSASAYSTEYHSVPSTNSNENESKLEELDSPDDVAINLDDN